MTDKLSSPVGDPAEIARLQAQFQADLDELLLRATNFLLACRAGCEAERAQREVVEAELRRERVKHDEEAYNDMRQAKEQAEAQIAAQEEEFDRLFQAVEGYRCGSLTRDGLMHYYEIARQFRIAHPVLASFPAAPVSTTDDDDLTRSVESMDSPPSVSTRPPEEEA